MKSKIQYRWRKESRSRYIVFAREGSYISDLAKCNNPDDADLIADVLNKTEPISYLGRDGESDVRRKDG